MLKLAQDWTGLPQLTIINTIYRKSNCTGNWRGFALWGVPIVLDAFLWRLLRFRECSPCFGRDAVVAMAGEPQWLALIPRAWVQMYTAVAQWRFSSSRFSLSLLLPFVDFPIHKVHQGNCNYGALQSAESCADLSFQGAFPTSGFKCLVHRNQPASHCFPDL